MNNRKAFFTALFATLAFLLPVYAVTALWQLTQPKAADLPAAQVPLAVPGAEDVKTLLLISQTEKDDRAFVLLHLDALHNHITLCTLPAETVILNDGTPRTLADAFAYAGPAFAANGIAETLGISIDHYLSGSGSDFSLLAEGLGSVTLMLAHEVAANSSEGYEIYRHAAGKAVVRAAEARLLLQYAAFTGQERAELTHAIYSQFFLLHLSTAAAASVEIVRSNSNLFTTNLGAADLYRYERILGFLARLSPDTADALLPGLWNNERYELGADSLAFAQENFCP